MSAPSDSADASPANVMSPKKRLRDAEACSHRRLRVKLSPHAQAHDSSASEPSISDESALISTTVGEEDTEPSDVDTDSESELSESSEEPSSESSSDEEELEDDPDDELAMENEDENGVVNLRAHRGKKPKIKLGRDDLGPDLRPFLANFLPEMKKANEELEVQKNAGTLKGLEHTNEEEEQHIEMDLGLGVLEEKDPDAESSSESDSDERDIMGKLMAREPKESAGIHEVGT
ncbi:hypothetical protein BDV96DRAFT_648573 [Lophiotrema nucula]|uniref:Uncharacterized protein n=1 Tax=Lophiotrema nucula TaxID=690887 RepID=A0A6A5Z0I7_9PLEO|nr:hypothetical protein BDV96DRAFT_648573 [Lophiotrema nucula]